MFDGQFLPLSVIPPDTPEKQKQMGAFMGGVGAVPASVERAENFIKTLQAEYSHITKWAILGLCWGGKVLYILRLLSYSR